MDRARRTAPAVAIGLIAALLLVGIGAPLAGAAPPGPPRAVALHSGPVGPTPLTVPALAVLGNIALANGSYRIGTTLGPNGFGPTSLAYDSLDERIFVAAGGPSPGVLAFSSISDVAVGQWAIPGGPSAAPLGLAFDPTTDLLFAADGSSGNVSVFSASTGALRNTTYLGAGTDPTAVAVDPLGGAIVVTESAADAVALLNASTGAFLAAVPVGAGPDALCFDPVLSEMVVANGGASTVTPVDAGARSAGHAVGVGRSPDAVAFDYDAGEVVVANRGSGNVSLLYAANLTTNTTRPVGPAPSAVAISTNGIAFVPDARGANVTVLNDPRGTTLGAFAVGPDPVAAVWDPSNGLVFVASAGNDSLAALSATQLTYVGTIEFGAEPVASTAVGFADLTATADAAGAAMEIVNDSTGTILQRVALPGNPVALAYVPSLGEVAASVPSGGAGGGNLTMIDPVRGRIVAEWPAGPGPSGVLWSSSTGALLVADTGNGTVRAIDPRTGAVNGTYTLPGHGDTPVDEAVIADRLFVSEGASNATVEVFNLTSGQALAGVGTPAGPGALWADAADATIWAADMAAGSLTRIDASALRATGNLTVGGHPSGLAAVPGHGLLAVADGRAGTLVLVDPTNVSVVTSIPVGASLAGVSPDPTNGRLLADDAVGGDLALIGPPPPRYPVRFLEVGLPGSAPDWSVTVDGTPVVGNATTLTVDLPNGTHAYTIAPAAGLFPTPAAGQFQVTGGPANLTVDFGPLTYNTSFIESGLPSGTAWWVAVDGTNLSGTGDALDASLPNGSFAFVAGTGALFAPSGGTGRGTVVIAGASPPPAVVAFAALPPFVVVFQETGLPQGVDWSVELGTLAANSSTNTVAFRTGPGQWEFQIPAAGGRLPAPSTGQVTVAGRSPAPINISFGPPAPVTFPVVFQVRGANGAGSLSVVLDGIARSGPGVVTFDEPNGTYEFRITAPAGYRPVPSQGNVTVAGRPQQVNVTLASAPGTNAPAGFGIPTPFIWGVLGAAAATAAVLLLVLHRRRPGRVRRLSGELVRPGPRAPGSDGPKNG